MTKLSVALALAALTALSQSEPAQAGCLGGAVVGGAAGHFAGHHGLLGAAAGCAVGHHASRVRRERDTRDSTYSSPDGYRAPNRY